MESAINVEGAEILQVRPTSRVRPARWDPRRRKKGTRDERGRESSARDGGAPRESLLRQKQPIEAKNKPIEAIKPIEAQIEPIEAIMYN